VGRARGVLIVLDFVMNEPAARKTTGEPDIAGLVMPLVKKNGEPASASVSEATKAVIHSGKRLLPVSPPRKAYNVESRARNQQ
jgi:hypothetical protein